MQPRTRLEQRLHGGLAQYVLERLVAERRVTAQEIASYIGEIPAEILRLEARLNSLRGSAAPDQQKKTRRPRPLQVVRSARKSAGKALGGTFGGLIRRVPKAEQEQYRAIKTTDGISAAIAALQARPR